MQSLNTSQRIGIVIVVVIIALMECFVQLVPQRQHDTYTLSVQDSLTIDSIAHAYARHTIGDTLCLQVFDPNTADSITLQRLGLRPWQVHNLLHYRAKGGRFRKAEQLSKLYGLTDSAYLALKPYIQIDTLPFAQQRDSIRHARETAQHTRDSLYQQWDSLYTRIKKDTILELNSTDTCELQFIRGIGRYTAMHIIRYRKQLRGYHSPEQVREIAALHTHGIALDSIIPHLRACADSIVPIPVNRASVSQLEQHPYISAQQAQDIYQLRRRKIRLQGIDELVVLPCVTDSDLLRLRPYLSFESR